jgi:hypothetical protein
MSPASYLTAPPRVAADSVTGFALPATIAEMWSWVVYGALVASFLAVAGAVGYLVSRVLHIWRTVKHLRRGLGRELNRLADLGEATVEKTAAASDSARLDASLARLRVTLARLAVLRSAVDEVQDGAGRITAVYPRK